MITLQKTQCCGVMEIENLCHATTPLDALQRLKEPLREGFVDNRWGQHDCHQVILVTFTAVTKRVCMDHASGRMDNYGQAFASYLTEHGLGEVRLVKEVKNWTLNTVGLWIWEPDYKALWKHLAEGEVRLG
jgi:hypothetical protein